jgi:RNase P subunit RPR2
MVIEVVSVGNKQPENRAYRRSCNNCGSLLQFKRKDARYVNDQRDGDAVVIDCPVCGAEVWTAADAHQRDWTDDEIKALARRMGA